MSLEITAKSSAALVAIDWIAANGSQAAAAVLKRDLFKIVFMRDLGKDVMLFLFAGKQQAEDFELLYLPDVAPVLLAEYASYGVAINNVEAAYL